MQIFIKNLGIIICCIYCYIKLLHISVTRKSLATYSIFSILLALISIFSDLYFPYITMSIIVLCIAVFLSLKTNTQLSVSIMTATISFALSYSIFTFSITIISFCTLACSKEFDHIYLQISSCMLQLLLMLIPFRLKRTKNGMPFLKKQYYSISGMIISIFLLLASTLLNADNRNQIYIIPYILIFIFATLIYLYWKKYLTKTYLDKLNIKNIESLNTELLEKQQYIESLEEDNQRLAKIIHKDNKLIPAMEYAVETYLKESTLTSENTSRGIELLEELSRLSADRKGMVTLQDRQCAKIPSCGIKSLDNLLQYIQQKAFEANITFHVTQNCDLKHLTHSVIDENTLYTVLADLLENAIIATKYNNGKHIHFNISMLSKYYSLHVFDSGVPFTKEVLVSLGQKQITTHADDSGSGIGLMQMYEILKQHNASLLIDEFVAETGLYTKKISVIFNKLNQYTLYTSRDEEEAAFLSQRTDLTVIQK